MKNILLAIMLLMGISASSSAEGLNANKEPEIKARKVIKKPRKRPIIQYNYYTTTLQSNCDKYINIIKEKDKEIEALSKEVHNLRGEKYETMRQEIKEEYNKEMEKFEKRRNSKREESSFLKK